MNRSFLKMVRLFQQALKTILFYLLDPQNVIDISDIIANKLSQLDFKNRSHYLARSQLFKDQLSARMVSWTRRLNKVPNKKIFTSNNSYNYFYIVLDLKV